MKKRLEAELISIAHRILKLKNKSDVDQLYKETQKLYETLSVLKFYQDNFEAVKSDLTEEDLEEKLEQSHEENPLAEPKAEVKQETPVAEEKEQEVVAAAEPEREELEEEIEEEEVHAEPEANDIKEVSQPESEEEVAAAIEEEPVAEAEEEVVEEKPAFEPIFELEAEEAEEAEEVPEPEIVHPSEEEKEETKKVALEHFLGENYVDPVFVKPNEVSLFPNETKEEPKKAEEPIKEEVKPEAPKTAAMQDAMSKSIAIGLNDRIGFVQHLFNDSNEDFNRVISQLNTFDTFEEAKSFINEMVIPDYGYWVGQEDYMERFMEIVENKFK